MEMIFFWAEWNTRSRNLLPIIKDYCNENDIPLQIIDVEDDEDAMEDYDIEHVPALLVLNDDVPVLTHYGKFDKDKLDEILSKI